VYAWGVRNLIIVFAGVTFVIGAVRFWLYELRPRYGALVAATSISELVPDKSAEVSLTEIVLTGDIMLGRTVMTTALDKKDPVYPFRDVADKLKEADLVFANLENPIVEDCPRHYDGFKFCADPMLLEGLVFSGVDVVTLANNHTGNYGLDGFSQTKRHLKARQIDFVGDNNFVSREINGIKFGFLGFDFVDRHITQNELDLVKRSKTQVDILLAGVHWGVEYKDVPSQKQKEIGEKLADSGADIIVGHHPHWVQPWEYINGKLVFWSLGNFIFDQMWSEETRSGMAVKVTFKGNKIHEVSEMPLYMDKWARPQWR
jgi:poly-gamma-glutamate capsule biosynthesis protein CapA/YwtB (metallophosphatase superfamily)